MHCGPLNLEQQDRGPKQYAAVLNYRKLQYFLETECLPVATDSSHSTMPSSQSDTHVAWLDHGHKLAFCFSVNFLLKNTEIVCHQLLEGLPETSFGDFPEEDAQFR